MSRRGWALFAAMSVIWGIPYLLIKVAVGGVPVPVLVLARVGIGAALLLPLALRRRQLSALRPQWRWLAAFAVVEIITPWLLLSDAERRLSSSMTGLLVASGMRRRRRGLVDERGEDVGARGSCRDEQPSVRPHGVAA